MIVPDAADGHGMKPIPTIIPAPTEYQTAGDDGFRSLWIVFVVMVVSSILFAALSWKIPVSRRVYHITTTLVTVIAAVSYFAVASGHATVYNCITVKDRHGHHIPDTHHEICRQVFWGRYVGWSLTGPLLLVDLCLLAGVDGAHTIMAIVASVIMALSGMFAAFGHEHNVQKWGWYTISCISYVLVVWHVAVHSMRAVKAKGGRVKTAFASLAGFSLLLWTIYPIVWGVADGSRKATVNSEIIVYSVLDILTKPVFGLWLLIVYARTPEIGIDLGGYWTHGVAAEGAIRIGENEDNS